MNKAVILLVDDQPANLLTLEHVLKARDRSFLKAKTGEEALGITLTHNIDLIILDVHLPGKDGFEVAQILKSNCSTRDIPIIFATAVSKEHKFIMKGYDEGAVDFFYKPLDPDIVKAKVAVLLKLQMQKKELVEKNLALEKTVLLIDNSADAIGIVDASTLRLEEFNQAFTSILGYQPEEVKNISLCSFLTAESAKLIVKLATSEQKNLFFETGIYCKNRELKWLQWKVVVIEGKWFFNARDITDVKDVHRIRNYLATVVQQSNDAIYIYNGDGNIISWNQGAENIYGFAEYEALQMSIWDLIPQLLQREMAEKINSISAENRIHDLETQRITKSGKVIDVLFSAAVIEDEGNKKRSIAITEREITEQKKAVNEIRQLNEELEKKVEEKTRELKQSNLDLEKRAQELEASNIELERFAFVASHDLQEPLRMVTSFLSLLHMETSAQLSSEAQGYIHFALQGAERMKNLIEALLEYSRVGSQEQIPVKINSTALVKNLIADFDLTLRETGAFINVHPLPWIVGVESQIRHVFRNLISNALKYHGCKNPRIEIGCTEKDHFNEFYVRDHGIGFDEKYADKIFIIFQRLNDNSEYSGTGIGLAICKKIIERSGGKIWAESKPRKGSTFYFTLPKGDQL